MNPTPTTKASGLARFGLGTVQLGMAYGLSNHHGQPGLKEAQAILNLAREEGLSLLDTAPAYGQSEQVLGNFLHPTHPFKIVTKTPSFIQSSHISDQSVLELVASFQRSLKRLRIPRIYGLLIHRAADLLMPGGERLWLEMQGLVEAGLVEKIGVSVYSGEEIDAILERFSPTLIQLPINLFDQRLIASGHLRRLKDRGVEIHARSIFLQGVLLMAAEAVPDYFEPVRGDLLRYQKYLQEIGWSRLRGALAFVMSLEELDHILVGVATSDELADIVEEAATVHDTFPDWEPFALKGERFLNPALWETA
ncbi:MAG: aldo/keto reductase [Magnetococcales bacterium]|nr:aldo/keto reductase [Magnetococcales bacterium]